MQNRRCFLLLKPCNKNEMVETPNKNVCSKTDQKLRKEFYEHKIIIRSILCFYKFSELTPKELSFSLRQASDTA